VTNLNDNRDAVMADTRRQLRRLDIVESQVRATLAKLLRVERHCPCGARPESPVTHPHVPGCELAAAIDSLRGLLGDPDA